MRRWSELSPVDRVDVYTRQSLYLLLWLFVVLFLLSAFNQDDGQNEGAFLFAALGAAALTAVAHTVLRDVMALHPALAPLPWRGMTALLVLSAITVTVALTQPDAVRGAVVMVVLLDLGWALGGLRDHRILAALVLGLGVLLWATTGEPLAFLGGVMMAAFFILTVRASLWLVDVVTELDTARTAQAALAVAEERLRFSRDVHDVLGRRLSAIAMQSELAASLVERGDPGAVARVLGVRQVAHEALREARELARGYRAPDLRQELEGARSLLASAGVGVRLDVDEVPEPCQEPAAWVVREAVTNVLRHSAATQVVIAFRDSELVVSNDGVTGPAAPHAGSGLDGLRERLAPLGATLTSTRTADGFRLTARFAAVPAEAG